VTAKEIAIETRGTPNHENKFIFC